MWATKAASINRIDEVMAADDDLSNTSSIISAAALFPHCRLDIAKLTTPTAELKDDPSPNCWTYAQFWNCKKSIRLTILCERTNQLVATTIIVKS